MTDLRMMGVSVPIQEGDIRHLSDREQDDLIRDIGLHLERELRRFVKDAHPVGELVYQVQGPHDDPLQGKVWVHVLAGHFDLDKLDHSSQAYITHVTRPDAGVTAVDFKVPD